MSASLVGSEMCIRDRGNRDWQRQTERQGETERKRERQRETERDRERPVSYTHLTLPTICSV
eukprot:13365626-Alexandrium_andersonii.AAC.1